MRHLKLWHFCICIVLLKNNVARTQTIVTTTQRPAATSMQQQHHKPSSPETMYFLMDVNGNYKYAFNTGNGFEGEQSATHTNEVTGHYTFYENGVPYMVKYKSGIKGYQPEVIPRPNGQLSPKFTQFIQLGGSNGLNSNLVAGVQNQANANANLLQNIAPTTQLHTLPSVNTHFTAGGGSLQTTLKFVNDALKTMQMQPLRLSFTTHEGSNMVQQQQKRQTSAGIENTAHIQEQQSTQSVNKVEMPQQHTLNTVLIQPQQQQQHQQQQQQQPQDESKRPYNFSYNGDQSARTESADQQGTVVGKYSYNDEAGFHDLSYKAGDEIGFVILGGSLAKPKVNLNPLQHIDGAQLIVNVAQSSNGGSYQYRVQPTVSNTMSIRDGNNNHNNRSLRKFRRSVKL